MRMTVILIAPARVGNIGAVVRAMKAMDPSELWVVDSQTHLGPAIRWVAYGSGGIIDNIEVLRVLAESLHDVDFAVATATCSRAKYHCYTMLVGLVPLLEEKFSWMSHAALVSGCEGSGLTNGESVLAGVPIGVLTTANYPSPSLGQVVMVYRYQSATLVQQPAKSDTMTDQCQLQALHGRAMTLPMTPAAADDIKLVDWSQQRLRPLKQRDIAVLCRLLHNIEKNITK